MGGGRLQAPFAFLIMLQMCLMAEHSLCRGSHWNPGGLLMGAVVGEKKKVRGQGGEGRGVLGRGAGASVGQADRERGERQRMGDGERQRARGGDH